MSVARTARRRRKQAIQGYTHLAKLSPNNGCSRPIYHRKRLLTVQEAIAKERRQAAQEQARKKAAK